MKKKVRISIAVLVYFTFFISSAFAQFVSLDNAKNVAVALFNERKPDNRAIVDASDIKTEFVEKNNGVVVYYIFNFSTDAFAIIAADYRILPILGYSFEGIHNPQNTPDCMDWLLSEYSQQIYEVVSQNLNLKDADIIAEWEKYENVGLEKSGPTQMPSLMSVNPLMTTTWSQGCYYNESCPADNTIGSSYCGRVPVGCVATAFGQVLKYHNHPAQGVGSNSYASNYGTLSANFGTTTYNWASMPNKLTANNTHVAKLLYHAGVSINMEYTPDASSAYTVNIVSALENNFKYATTANNVPKSSYTNTQWNTLIKTEIDAQRVVIIEGFDPTENAGHAFVADGYQGTNSFHINWGWDGSDDGYFVLTALNPSGYAFNSDVTAIIGIKPISTNTACSMVTGLSTTGVTSSSATLKWLLGTGGTSNTFNVKYKKTTTSTWTTVTATTNSKVITGLTPGTAYHFQVQRVCGGTSTSNYSASTTFTTLASSSSGTTVTVGAGTATTGVAPYGTSSMDERVQFIITKSELVAGGFTSATNYIKSLAFNVASANNKTMTSFTIKMGHTTATSFLTSSFLTSSLTTVFSGNVTAVSGWNTHTFNSSFLYNGSSNLLIEICWNNTSAASNSTVRQTVTTTNKTLYLKTNVANGNVCSNTTGTKTTSRPNMRFAFSSSALKMADETEVVTTDEVLEVVENEALSMRVFPNPTADYTTIEVVGDLESNTELTVFDLTGRKIFTDIMTSNTYQLAVENYAPGSYLVVIKNGNTTLNQKLLVKMGY